MSIFKQNSRFGILAEEASTSKEKKKNNTNKNNNNNNNNKINEDRFKIVENTNKGENNSFKSENNSFKKSFDDRPQRNSLTNRESKEYIERRAIEEKLRKEENDIIKSKKLTEALCLDNFPTLGKNIEYTNSKNITSFLAKLNTSIEDDKKLFEVNHEEVKLGWARISRDTLTGITNIKYSEPVYKNHGKCEQEMEYDVLNALCDLYEKRTAEYIELYGYDIWEKTFKLPNWEDEEEYFDSLDEEYQAQIEEYEENKENNSEFVTDPDRFNKYWEQY